MKYTREPSGDAPTNCVSWSLASGVGSTAMRRSTPSADSYESMAVSVSSGTSDSWVRK